MSDPGPYLYQRRWFWAALACMVAAIAGYEALRGNRPPTLATEEEFKTQRYIVPQPAVTEFRVVPAAQAGDLIKDADLVLGLTVGGQARAYPLKMLNGRPKTKALNDVLGGTPILAAWCDKCQSGMAYDRRVGAQTLTFNVFGSLWRDSMVLHDAETKSQWSQGDGRAYLGPLRGERLRQLPSVIVAWNAWRTMQPESSVIVLDDVDPEFPAEPYVPPEDYVLTTPDGNPAWGLDELERRGVMSGTWDNIPVAGVYLKSSGTARMFGRVVDGRTLTLTMQDDVLRDAETGGTWDPVSGVALSGPIQGVRLPPVASMIVTREAWRMRR